MISTRNEPTNQIKLASAAMSKRGYIALTAALTAIGFAVMTASYLLFMSPEFRTVLPQIASPAFSIVALVASILGLVVQWMGTKRESVPMCLVGFAIVSVFLGVVAGAAIQIYEIESIAMALGGTVVIAIVFGAAGFAFPDFFAKIHGLLIIGLLAMIIVEVICLLFGISQIWTSWVVLVIFCGLIGYDFYAAANDYPTKINAVLHATSIYLDLINVFLRLLAIFGRRR